MKDTFQQTPVMSKEKEQAAPQGIGMAVAFDWGITIQLLAMPFLPLFIPNLAPFGLGPLSRLTSGPLSTALVSFLVSLPFAALVALFGEGVRRGWRWTCPIQITFNVLGFLGGFATLVSLWQGIKVGNYWELVTTVILLIFSPLIAWRLSRPATRQWFARVSSAEARRRHGGAWPWLILCWSLVGGVLQAIAALQK